ncbi:MAG: hypothetical protein ACNA8H_09735 [Anaerolineales bacterium]
MTTTQLNSQKFGTFTQRFHLQKGVAYGLVLVVALLAFEIFNYSSTEYALSDLLGELGFVGLRWAIILAVALCGIDTAGIAWLFTSGNRTGHLSGVWYLFVAWLLAATMNAIFTWWGVSVAMMAHESLGSAMIAGDTFLYVLPVFVAIMVWLIRVLIIGTISLMGTRFFLQGETPLNKVQVKTLTRRSDPIAKTFRAKNPVSQPNHAENMRYRQPAKSRSQKDGSNSRPDPTYHPASMSARGEINSGSARYRR